MRRAFSRGYGAHPMHLLSLLACFALAGYAALQASRDPLAWRMAIWFLGALVLHDLVLFPLYALVDRSLSASLPRRRRLPSKGGVNYVRVPALISGLLLLLFWPVIFRHSEGAYGAAAGLDQSPYLARYLLIVAVLFAGSALLYALTSRRP